MSSKVFNSLKEYFKGSHEDVLVVHSHKFLNKDTNNEKDFILLNLTRGYVLVIEVKANQSKYQTAIKQLFDAKAKIEDILASLGFPTGWKYVGVFFAQTNQSGKPLFECDNCMKYVINGPENIADCLKEIELEIRKSHQNWNPEEHVDEFVN